MKIVIDMQPCQTTSRYRGVGRYTHSITKALLNIDHDNEYHLILNQSLGYIDEIKEEFKGLLPEANIHTWIQYPGLSAYKTPGKEILVCELIREALIATINPDLVFLPNLQEGWEDGAVNSINKLNVYTNRKYLTTLHDIIPLIYENEYLAEQNPIRPWYFDKLKLAKECTKSSLIHMHHCTKLKSICSFRMSQLFLWVLIVLNSIILASFHMKM